LHYIKLAGDVKKILFAMGQERGEKSATFG